MVSLKQQLVSSRAAVSSGVNACDYITIHETANTSRGAGAQSHANLQSRGNSRNASWHYQVDDKIAIQSFRDHQICWHAGSGTGNRRSIGIEICVNSDGNFKKAVQNAAELTTLLMKRHNIPASRVVQHNHWSGKDCPRFLRHSSKGISWSQFKGMLGKGTAVSGTSSDAMDYKTFRYGQMLTEGMGGAAAKRMQEDLTKLGYPLVADGKLGPASDRAIRAFQLANGLTVDGYAGEATQKRITELLNELNNPKPKPQEVAQVAKPKERDVLETHREGWEWAEKEGLLNGKNPAGELSREQFATVLKRFHDKYIQK